MKRTTLNEIDSLSNEVQERISQASNIILHKLLEA